MAGSEVVQNFSSIHSTRPRALVTIKSSDDSHLDNWQSALPSLGGVVTLIRDAPTPTTTPYITTASGVDYQYAAGSYQKFTTVVRAKDAVDIAYALPSETYNVELDLTYKLTRFEEVCGLFIESKARMIRVKIFLDIDSYDYDLMQNIINQVESPVQKKLGIDTLITFNYVYGTADSYFQSIIPQEKCLFKKQGIYGK